MAVGDKYHSSDVEYAPNEAEYDAHDFQYHIVDHSADIIAMFPDKDTRDRWLEIINDAVVAGQLK